MLEKMITNAAQVSPEWLTLILHEKGVLQQGKVIQVTFGDTYQSVLPALPMLFNRHASGRNLTLVHGDAHLGNFLFPIEAQTASAYLINWQFWRPTIGGADLAFMIATEWKPQTRRRLKTHLLRRYDTGLIEHGVSGYSWEDCWNDYRLSVILVSIFIPVWRWSIFQWAPDFTALESSMTAFADLNCSELLEGGMV